MVESHVDAGGDERNATDLSEGASFNALTEFAAVLIRYWRMLIVVPIATAVISVGVGLLLGAQYTATTVLQPRLSSLESSGVSSLAASLGFSLGSLDGGETLDFYVVLFRSRPVLESLVRSEYGIWADEEQTERLSGDLIELLEIEEETPEDDIKSAVEWLEGAVSVGRDPEAGLVTITATAPWPDLSEALGRALLEEGNDFNLQRRQDRAHQERVFVEGRLNEAREELAAEESAMKAFLDSNRMYESSPRLRFERDAIQRRLDVRQQVYLSLAQAYEQARIEEVRNTPVLAVIEAPEGSAEIETGPIVRAVFGVVLGFLAVVLLIASRESWRSFRRENPRDVDYIASLLRKQGA